MKYVTLECELCHKRLELPPGATAKHLSCPKKKPSSHPPIYVEVKE